jgi:hypothetical protein
MNFPTTKILTSIALELMATGNIVLSPPFCSCLNLAERERVVVGLLLPTQSLPSQCFVIVQTQGRLFIPTSSLLLLFLVWHHPLLFRFQIRSKASDPEAYRFGKDTKAFSPGKQGFCMAVPEAKTAGWRNGENNSAHSNSHPLS